MDDATRCYQLLEVPEGASPDQLKQAYRDLVKVWHPDRFAHDERLRLKAQEKLKEINGAYEFLRAKLFAEGIDPGPAVPPEPAPAAEAPPEAAAPVAAPPQRFAWWSAGVLCALLLVAGACWWGWKAGRAGAQRASAGRPGTTGNASVASVARAPAGPVETGWQTLFDGKSTAHWHGIKQAAFPSRAWAVDHGTLKALAGGEAVDLVTRESYEDFELEFEWRISHGGASGLMFWVNEDIAEPWLHSPAMSILDDTYPPHAKEPKAASGALFGMAAPANARPQPTGEWNQSRIVVDGKLAEYWLNGGFVAEFEPGSEAFQKLVAQSRFKDQPHYADRRPGPIALRHAGSEVWFRNVRIRRRNAPIVADVVYTCADDFMVDAFHNGRRLPEEHRTMTVEHFGATCERLKLTLREGDWLVFNVANNRLRWGGAYYFGAAGLKPDLTVGFVSERQSGRWSCCDDPGDVPRFIAERDYLAANYARSPERPWGGGPGFMRGVVKDWNGDAVWGTNHTTWVKFRAVPAKAR